MVAQIDKEQLPMISLAMHPARQPRVLPSIGKAQRAASMGAIFMHRVKTLQTLESAEDARIARDCQGERPHTGMELYPRTFDPSF